MRERVAEEIERKREGVDERRKAGTMVTRSESEEAKGETITKGGKGASFPRTNKLGTVIPSFLISLSLSLYFFCCCYCHC